MPETVEQFASRVKAKYPEYSSVPDVELAQRVLSKHPEYKSVIGGNLPGAPPPPTMETSPAGEAYNLYQHLGQEFEKVPQGLHNLAQQFSDAGKGKPEGLKALGHTAAETIKAPVRELAGRPQPNQSVLTAPQGVGARVEGAISMASGGDPVAGRAALLEGNSGEAAIDFWAVPLATLGVGRVLESGGESQPTHATKEQVGAMQMLLGRERIGGSPVETAHRTAQLQTVLQQAAQELGKSDATLKQSLPGTHVFAPKGDYIGQVTRGNQFALDLSKQAVDITQRPFDALMNTYGREALPKNVSGSVLGELDSQIASSVDDGVKAALRGLKQKIEQAKTISDIYEIKKHANKEADALYSPIPGKGINASAQSAYAYKLTADAIREHLYPELGKLSRTGLDLTDLGKREADAISLRDGMHDLWSRQVLPAEASRDASRFGDYIFGQGHDHSLYSRHIIRRAAEKTGLLGSEGERFNRQTRQAVGEIGTGFQPERVQTKQVAQKALPGSTAPYRFTIATGLPEESVSPSQTSTRKSYQGTKQVPYEAHDPLSQPTGSHYVGGTPAEQRIRSTGAQTPNVTIPERSATGPETRTQTIWQQIAESSGGEVERGGGGILSTSDPKVAQKSLDGLRGYIKSSEFRNLSNADRVRVLEAARKLGKELEDFHAYKGKTPPQSVTRTPAKRGRSLTPISKNARTTAAATVSAGRRTLPPT